MEMAEWNQEWINRIRSIKTTKEMVNLWDEIKEEAFLSYKVDPKMIDAGTKDFSDLGISNQKRFLIECLDKNHLYVNFSDIDDKEYKISGKDKKLNKIFYGSL
jgi:adenine-specific DNA-methyltransferase